MENRMAHTVLLPTIAECVCSLLGCDAACLILHCFDHELCHPRWREVLLTPVMQSGALPYYGTITEERLLAAEQVWAACDLSMQRGELRMLDAQDLSLPSLPDCASAATANTTACMLVAPLECPAGVLGVLLCTARVDKIPDRNACRLLQQLLPHVARLVESALAMLDGKPGSKDSDVVLDEHTATAADPWQSEPAWLWKQAYKHEDVALFTNLNTDELLSVVSHDLRTPLSVIKGYVGLLQAYGYPEDDGDSRQGSTDTGSMSLPTRQRYFSSVMEQINHLEVLIGDLLDVSRIRAGRVKLNPCSLSVGRLCQQVVQQLQDRTAQQEPGRYMLRCMVDPSLPSALADADRVQQVITNLVENAMKYSPDGGLIEIFVYSRYALYHSHTLTRLCGLQERTAAFDYSVAPSSIYVTVRDHGIGIAPAQQKMLFQPFTRLPQAATSNIYGAGLGLYISQRLIEAMHGRIALKSHPGQGTSITFSLPAVDHSYRVAHPVEQPSPAQHSASLCQTLSLTEQYSYS